jgi:hypothetical protein
MAFELAKRLAPAGFGVGCHHLVIGTVDQPPGANSTLPVYITIQWTPKRSAQIPYFSAQSVGCKGWLSGPAVHIP